MYACTDLKIVITMDHKFTKKKKKKKINLKKFKEIIMNVKKKI